MKKSKSASQGSASTISDETINVNNQHAGSSQSNTTSGGLRSFSSVLASNAAQESKMMKDISTRPPLPQKSESTDSSRNRIVRIIFTTIRQLMESLPKGQVKTALKCLLCLKALLALRSRKWLQSMLINKTTRQCIKAPQMTLYPRSYNEAAKDCNQKFLNIFLYLKRVPIEILVFSESGLSDNRSVSRYNDYCNPLITIFPG